MYSKLYAGLATLAFFLGAYNASKGSDNGLALFIAAVYLMLKALYYKEDTD
jgi:hypothetical protein